MISLQIQSCNQGDSNATMIVEYSDGIVGLTVTRKDEQFYFTLDSDEWEQIKLFIETAIQQEDN